MSSINLRPIITTLYVSVLLLITQPWISCCVAKSSNNQPWQQPPPPTLAATCNASEPLNETDISGVVFRAFHTDSVDECKQACCDQNDVCMSWTLHSNVTAIMNVGKAAPPCADVEGSCCTLSSQATRTNHVVDSTAGFVYPPPIPPHFVPQLTHVMVVANDSTGGLRDPSAMIQDPSDGTWHFYVVYFPPGHRGFTAWLHHYSAPEITGPWTNNGMALNHSADPNAQDSLGMFSPSVVYDNGLFYLFYSATGYNFTTLRVDAQMLATAPTPRGPWTRQGVVTSPVGTPDTFNKTWNGQRLDSGRAMIVNGQRAYYTKGTGRVQGQEGVYFPVNGSSFLPPYREWIHNPIWNASENVDTNSDGYENCEFFKGPDDFMHVICQNHGAGELQPHFLALANETMLHWRFVGNLNTYPALEPTPVYEGGQPGDKATVNYMLARVLPNKTETPKGGPEPLGVSQTLRVDLFKVDWVPANITNV